MPYAATYLKSHAGRIALERLRGGLRRVRGGWSEREERELDVIRPATMAALIRAGLARIGDDGRATLVHQPTEHP